MRLHIEGTAGIHNVLVRLSGKENSSRTQNFVRKWGLFIGDVASVTYKIESLFTFKRYRCVQEACSSVYDWSQSDNKDTNGFGFF